MKNRKYKIDEWVLYDPHIAGQSTIAQLKAVVLEVLENDLFYDYRIFVDGRGTITKVREENLFPCEETT
jgi:hypothetical protein